MDDPQDSNSSLTKSKTAEVKEQESEEVKEQKRGEVKEQGSEDIKQQDLYKNLHSAIKNEDETLQSSFCNTIKAAIQSDNDKVAADVVLMSARDSDLTVLRFLLQNIGADCLKVKDSHGNTIVHLAVEFQNGELGLSALQLMIQKLGRDCFRVENFKRRTAFHSAAINQESPSALRWLLETQKPEVFFAPDSENSGAIHLAFEHQDNETVEKLIKKLGSKCLEVPGKNDRTAAHNAASNRMSPSVLLWLLETQVPEVFFAPDSENNCAIHLAFKQQTIKTVKKLVKKLGCKCLKVPGENNRTAAHYAAVMDDPSLLVWILETQSPEVFFVPDSENNCAIHLAFKHHNDEIVEKLVKKLGSKCLKVPGENNRTAAHYAAVMDDPSLLVWLLETQPPEVFFAPDSENNCAIHLAFEYQNDITVEKLIKILGSKCLEIPGKNQRTAAHYAARMYDPNLLFWILETQAPEVFFAPDSENNCAIHLAFEHQDNETVEKLVMKLGSKCLEVPGKNTRTVAHFAAEKYNPSALLWLLDTQAPEVFFAPDSENNCAIHLAFENQNDETVVKLVEKLGSKCLEVSGRNNRTVAHNAASNWRSPSALLWLLENLAPEVFFAPDSENICAIHLAFKKQDIQTVEMLVMKLRSKSLEVPGKHNRTAAHYAAKRNDPSLLLWLLQTQAPDVFFAPDSENSCAIHLAFEHQDNETVEKLIKKLGSKCLEVPGKNDRTAAHNAASNWRTPSALLWLLETQVPEVFFAPDSENNCAIHLALENQKVEIVEKLVQKLGSKCIEVPGKYNRTAAHYAAKKYDPSLLLWILETQAPEVFFTPDSEKNCAIHLTFEKQEIETVEKLIKKLGSKCLEVSDENNRTAAHYAASNWRSPSALLWLLENLAPEIFFAPDSENNCAIHLAFEKQEMETVQQLIMKLGSKCLKVLGKNNRTAAHYAASNLSSPSTLLWICDKLGKEKAIVTLDADNIAPIHLALFYQDEVTVKKLLHNLATDALVSRGYRNRSALHYAARNRKSMHVFPIVHESLSMPQRDEILRSEDADGRNCLHMCALNHEFGVKLLTSIFPLFGFSSASNAIKNSLDSDGRNPLFTACLAKNFQFIESQFTDMTLHNCIDTSGNTLLHALFQTFDPQESFDIDVDKFVETVKLFVIADVTTDAENALKQNCIFASAIDEYSLCQILLKISQSDTKAEFIKLQRNSEGLHAAHVFSRRYNIRKLEKSLCQLFDLSPDDLLKVRATDGPMKGATCLHFACEADHLENIKYLLSKGVKLTDQTELGHTFADLAYKKGKLHVLIDIAVKAGKDLCDILKLVDSPNRALQLPDIHGAKNLLTLFTDPALRSNIEKERSFEEKERSVKQMKDTPVNHETAGESPKVKLLFRALELDSREFLRSLMALNLVISDFNVPLLNYLIGKKWNEMDADQKQKFKGLKALRRDAKSQKLNTISTLTECAVYFNKGKLLTDLMLLPQFDIIPETLRLLIYLQIKVRNEQKNVQLMKVKEEALNTIINLIRIFYLNADSKEKKLILKYLTGTFEDKSQISSRFLGPRFPGPVPILLNVNVGKKKSENSSKIFNSKQGAKPYLKSMSIMELVDTLDCDDLFATDCISSLVERQWKEPPPLPWISKTTGRCEKCNIRFNVTVEQRFILHSAFFILFLAFFAWYVTDFGRTVESPAADIILLMYALSLSLQELNDLLNKLEVRDVHFRQMHIRMPRYFTDLFNYFDMIGLVFLWSGLVLKLLGKVVDLSLLRSSQMTLSSSFLFLGFRSVALLSYFKVTGPKISMLKSLLYRDLLPFLLIMLVLIYSFGVFFFNLLFPSISNARDAASVVKVFMIPTSLAFSNFENTQFVSCNSTDHTNSNDCADQRGNSAYNNILVFVYLVIVNIVMWNLLIALFSLTVSRMASRAEVLWRKTQFELLQEFSEVSPVPPPLSFPFYAWKLLCRAAQSSCGHSKLCKGSAVRPDDTHPDQKEWWRNQRSFAAYPEEYKKFLIFQAEMLRIHRPTLQRAVEKTRVRQKR